MTTSTRRDDFIKTFIEPLQALGKIKDYYNSKRGFRFESEINAQANVLYGVSSFFEIDDVSKIKTLQDWAKVESKSKRLKDSGGRTAAILGKYISYLGGVAPTVSKPTTSGSKTTRRRKDTINGDGFAGLYQILQAHNIVDPFEPSDEEKFLIETLILGSGIWFTPETYKEIPILIPYVIRDTSCRKKKTGAKKDEWGFANNKGLMRDDNTAIKRIPYSPYSLKIVSPISSMNGKKLDGGFVASHVWKELRSKPKGFHACNWGCTNSFIPNLVWLPEQISRLTDRDDSYAQHFIQHVSYLLYRSVSLPATIPSKMIWAELKKPSIKPITKIDPASLNYFEFSSSWIDKRKSKLQDELNSIKNVLVGKPPVISKVDNSKYLPTLAKVVKTRMTPYNKRNLENWLDQILSSL